MSTKARYEAVRSECDEIRKQLEDLRGDVEVNHLQDVAGKQAVPTTVVQLKQRRILKGHFGKIYAMHWSAFDSTHLVSASQDGKLIVWNGFTTNKSQAIPLRSAWVMTCAYSPSGSFVACGGLDNICSVYKLTDTEAPERKNAFCELQHHEGYLSCCRFIDDNEIISSSGDSTCILWDVEAKMPKCVYRDHKGDVMSVSIWENKNVFVSGSCDSTARVWDFRAGGAGSIATFTGHESDINSVQWLPDQNKFGTGSDDSTCRIFDMASRRQLGVFSNDKILCGITSVDFSSSGKFLFAGYDDYNCYLWDSLTTDLAQQLAGHENRVSCLGVSQNGKALCTGSWDTLLKIWA
ncbi:MAG: hypothetical protein MHM6MM_004809 [Cercozoa sp. M6MM]